MLTRHALGHGIGLRSRHYSEFLEGSPDIAWVEAISENFMGVGGRPMAVLEKARRDRPVVLHGVSLGIGSTEPLDQRYLNDLNDLIHRIEPTMVSDHLCWGQVGGRYSHDLLPLPYTDESLAHVVSRVQHVQELLGRQILLENPSTYLEFSNSDIFEAEYLAEVARRADCGVLLDVNNIYVNACNHGIDAAKYLEAIPIDRVGQFHLAGHQNRGNIVIDTHEGPIVEAVWHLYRSAVSRFGDVPCLVEWDEGVPELSIVLAESTKAQMIASDVVRSHTTEASR
jgi:uncharacterized protein